MFDPEADPETCARDLARGHPAALAVGDDLDRALKLFEACEESYLPVIDSEESMKVVGVVRHRDAIVAYNQALLRLRKEERGET